ncbi:EFR1 family ferrodoxin [Bacteroides sp. GD17]|jgi:ferredoxin|uniref:EFR1 family ferrodoxin n=1 Tax=Bacteroides sp. GD17 TaxID=3139826 RepID=UPI0025EEB539|nr:EFR1 family ferrodoxin [uncultured Bacteroides sp.]
MILYFTGTGNSRWVAERLAEATHDTTLNIADYLKNDSVPEELANADRVGLVFPVHAWYAPRVVVHFLLRLRLPHCKYRYAVCTCGDDMGKGMNRLAKRFPLDAAWSVAMPNTYIPMFDLDDDALCHQKIADVRHAIASIAEDVLQQKKVWAVHEGGAPWLKTYVLNPLFVRFIITSKGFHVDEGCISCAKCSKACPVENIQMVDGHPVWETHCIHCMACLHICPQKVIQYKKTSQKKGRYHLADYL